MTPIQPKPSLANLQTLLAAGNQLNAMIVAAGANKKQLMADFKNLRRNTATRASEMAVLD